MRVSLERIPQHRAQRRDPGAAGDEQQRHGVVGGQREVAERTLHAEGRAALHQFEMRVGRVVVIDLHQQLDHDVTLRLSGRAGDGVGPPDAAARQAGEYCLAGDKRKCMSVEIDSDDPGSRSGTDNLARRQR
jgi:hypothetical protein